MEGSPGSDEEASCHHPHADHTDHRHSVHSPLAPLIEQTAQARRTADTPALSSHPAPTRGSNENRAGTRLFAGILIPGFRPRAGLPENSTLCHKKTNVGWSF